MDAATHSDAVPERAQGPAAGRVAGDPDRLISAKHFDYRRTARGALALALQALEAEGGLIASLDPEGELQVTAAAGVDPDGVLENPQVDRLARQALESSQPVSKAGVPAGMGLPRAGRQTDLLATALRLVLRSSSEPEAEERRQSPSAALLQTRGVLVLACSPAPITPARLELLEVLGEHLGQVLTNARLYHQATRDPLTELYRRPELDSILEVELELAHQTGGSLAALMIDIDGLARINRDAGRHKGDRVIRRVARLVKSQLRRGDACVRTGGEEFAVVLPGTNPEGALATAERIRRTVAEAPMGLDDDRPVTISLGAAVYPAQAQSGPELLRKADQTLFVAKQEGDGEGNRSVLWSPRIPRHALRADKLVGIITGDRTKDTRNVMLLLDTVVLVNSRLERQRILSTLLDMMVQLAGASRGVLFVAERTPEGEPGALKLELAQDRNGKPLEPHGLPRVVIDRVHHTGTAVAILGESDGDQGGELAEACRTLGLARAVCLPLKSRGKGIGCIYVDAPQPAPDASEGSDRGPGREFEESDLVFMQALARELGAAIENNRLYVENLEQKRALEELTAQLARKVQAQEAEIKHMERDLTRLQSRFSYDRIVGKSEAMQKVFKHLERVTDSDVPVLIVGETGTGKELVARSIHGNGPRGEGPFVSVNCSTITESLMESELFGHVKGAFTGADRDKQGLFEQADGGTIFLDEVQDMSGGMQRELLRVLQEKEIRRVGGKEIIKVDVRVISATNRDLKAMVKASDFRQDLFYRLNVFSIDLPPLRDRKEDIPLLVERLLEDLKTPDGRQVTIDPEALRGILRHDWPGNIRELQNVIEKAALLIEGDRIQLEHVRVGRDAAPTGGVSQLLEMDYNDAKQAFAREYLKSVLAKNEGNVTRAAAEAGIVRSSFHKMMRKHGLSAKDFSR